MKVRFKHIKSNINAYRNYIPYIYIIGHYNPSVGIIDLTPLMLCVFILYGSGRTYSLKSTPNFRFFEKLFMAILFTLRIFVCNLLRGNHRINIFCILFWCLAWGSNPGFSSNKPTRLRPTRLHYSSAIVCIAFVKNEYTFRYIL